MKTNSWLWFSSPKICIVKWVYYLICFKNYNYSIVERFHLTNWFPLISSTGSYKNNTKILVINGKTNRNFCLLSCMRLYVDEIAKTLQNCLIYTLNVSFLRFHTHKMAFNFNFTSVQNTEKDTDISPISYSMSVV